MSNGTFALVLTAGAALLALWVDARLPKLAPASMRRVFLHVGTAMLALHLIPGVTSTTMLYVVLFGVALPALVYSFLTAIWFIRLAQSALGFRAR
ncbi:MAG TPA: hypothetical protein VNP93_03315 [Gaiellaceae bacterium]|nr:hypothetical protein [Gaiellaceae bacterium]